MAVTPGIEELILAPPSCSNAEYSFPCSVLSDGRGSSIRKLQFFHCAIRPTADLGCLITLSTLYLSNVRITGSELEIVLSSSPALEQLGMSGCKEIVRLKIPCMLKRLHSIRVFSCGMLKVVECYAPNISTFDFSGNAVQMLGLLPVKSQRISHLDGSRILRYALTKLMSIVPNVEILRLLSLPEVVSTATVRGKFLRLKHLNMSLPKNKTFDYLSLVGFLDASPSLQTFILNIVPINSSHVSVVGDSEQLTQMPERRHDNLKEFKIIGFYSAKSLVELTCHILETAPSLQCLQIDTRFAFARCDGSRGCFWYRPDEIMEARNAVLAIRTHIVGKVPPTVKLNVAQHCSRCLSCTVDDKIASDKD